MFCCTLPLMSRRSEFLGVLRPLQTHVWTEPSIATPMKPARLAAAPGVDGPGPIMGPDALAGVCGLPWVLLCNNSISAGRTTASTSSQVRAWSTCWRMLRELLGIMTSNPSELRLLWFVGVGG